MVTHLPTRPEKLLLLRLFPMAQYCTRLPFSFGLVPPNNSPSPSPTSCHLVHLAGNHAKSPPCALEIRSKKLGGTCSAVAETAVPQQPPVEESVLLPEESSEAQEKVEYDWREEWYPLYVTNDVPDDAPLGLTVFHKQLVLYKDGQGVMRCFEDRCPHRLAKLSEGQLTDGRLECLYHGWQFDGDGRCVNIPQLPEGAKIPRSACAKSYEVRDSQGVVWVWMSEKNKPDEAKLPWFEHYARPEFKDISGVHELPYDHSILLENLMDPAHVPISHDRTDSYSKRENACPLFFDIAQRNHRGFAGNWRSLRQDSSPASGSFLRFRAPCIIESNRETVDKDGKTHYNSTLFLCRPSGQGKTMLIVRFGGTKRSWLFNLFPTWLVHCTSSTILEQDMGFLSSQNETLTREKVPTKELYLNLSSCDTWVLEYRKWLDKVGHGMPYHVGHSTISLPEEPAMVEQAPAGLVAALSASFPAKGGVGTPQAPNLTNRYYRHVVHCKECRGAVRGFRRWRSVLALVGAVQVALSILASSRQWKVAALLAATACFVGAYACNVLLGYILNNFVRVHRRLGG